MTLCARHYVVRQGSQQRCATKLAPLASPYLVISARAGNRKVLKLRGEGGDHSHCTVEPATKRRRDPEKPSHGLGFINIAQVGGIVKARRATRSVCKSVRVYQTYSVPY